MANLQMETPPPTPSSPYGYNRLIEEVAPSDRGRAKKILDTLNQTNGFSWNSKTGAVRINKRRYADSHIKAILADAVANKRQLSTDEQFNLVSRMLQQ